jgi:hypothetical protein
LAHQLRVGLLVRLNQYEEEHSKQSETAKQAQVDDHRMRMERTRRILTQQGYSG